MELDRVFPKLIALDDKQGSIFLVDVEYTWIPSTCKRCGNLGHKAKRCLLPPKPSQDSTLPSNSASISADIPTVDIDVILHQSDNSTSSSETIHQKDQKTTENISRTALESAAPVVQSLTNNTEGLEPDVPHAVQFIFEAAPQRPLTLSDVTIQSSSCF